MSDRRKVDSSIDLSDVQGLVRFGFKHQTEAVYLLLQVAEAGQARAWLANADLTSAVDCANPPDTVLQIALTSSGLSKLGIATDIIKSFSEEFVEGMAGDPNRTRRLGDVSANDPGKWKWGAGDLKPDVAVFLYAKPGQLDAFRSRIERELQGGFDIVSALGTANMDDTEPFGFRDGISQPELDWERKRPKRDEVRLTYGNLSCLGEYLLGYPNEYGRYTPRPLLAAVRDPGNELPRAEDDPSLADLGRNGSYLVFRQLEQDVRLFWQAIDGYAGGDATARDMLAAAMVGRVRTGEPLVALLTPPSSVKPSEAAQDLNTFNYDADPDGARCPLGAHVRRVNPRTADFPAGTSGLIKKLIRTLGFDSRAREEDLIASTRFHRLLRRGREYGSANTETGIHFICLNASIQRQFEFVQSAWIMSTKFNGMRNESDPLLGNREPDLTGRPSDRFLMPQADAPTQCLKGLPQFITVRGGAYFFLPGIRALRYLATH